MSKLLCAFSLKINSKFSNPCQLNTKTKIYILISAKGDGGISYLFCLNSPEENRDSKYSRQTD